MTEQKINVLFIHPYKHTVGPNRVLFNLVQWLDRNKFNFFAVFPAKRPFIDELENNDVKTFFLPNLIMMPRTYNPLVIFNYFRKQLKNGLALKDFIKKNKIDIIHISTTAYWPIGAITKFCKVKCVFHAQDLTSMTPKIIGKINAVFLNFFADVIICVSNAVSTAWRQAGVQDKKLIVVYNGIDLDEFRPLPELEYNYLKKELNWSGQRPVVGMIAGMDPRKGHKYFIEAGIHISKELPQALFLIVGSLAFPEYAVYFEGLKQLIKNNNLEKSFIFLGERRDVAQIINLCDLMVVPSETEAGPFVVLEIQGCGRYIVASDVGGVSEYLDDNQAGQLIPAKNSMKLAQAIMDFWLKNPKRERDGRVFIMKFRIQDKIKEIAKIYEQLFISK